MHHGILAYSDLRVLVGVLLGTPPPAGLAALRGRLLLRTPPRLPAALGRLPLRGGLPARCATTTLRRHGDYFFSILTRWRRRGDRHTNNRHVNRVEYL